MAGTSGAELIHALGISSKKFCSPNGFRLMGFGFEMEVGADAHVTAGGVANASSRSVKKAVFRVQPHLGKAQTLHLWIRSKPYDISIFSCSRALHCSHTNTRAQNLTRSL